MSNTSIIKEVQHSIYFKLFSLLSVNKASLFQFSMIIVIFVILLSQCQTRETLLLSQLTSRNDRILFRLLKQTNYLIKNNRIFNDREMTCYSIIKNELTTNKYGKYLFINQSLTKQKLSQQLKSDNYPHKLTPEESLYFQIDSILNLLNGICLQYRTMTFITQYCHKEHVRQFDDQITKFYNQKPLFEDFLLGQFNSIDNQKPNIRENTNSVIPKKSNFYAKHLHQLVDGYDQSKGSIQLEQNDSNQNIVQSNAHLLSLSRFLVLSPIFINVKCFQTHKKQKRQINNIALAVSPFEFIYTNKQGKCDIFLQFTVLKTSIFYLQHQYLRVYQQFLFGNVQEICANNWNWQGDNKHYQDAEIIQGSVLLLQYKNIANQTQTQYVTVKKVYHAQLLQLTQKFAISFNSSENPHLFDSRKTKKIIHQFIKCSIMFKKPIQKQLTTISNTYLNRNMMILDQNKTNKPLTGTNLACTCRLNFKENINFIDMNVTVGSYLWLNYYQIYLKTNSLIYLYDYFKDVVFSQCEEIQCAPVSQKLAIQLKQKKQNNNKFTKTIKINSQNKIYKINQNNQNNIFIINIHNSGVIKLVTADSKGNKYTYILTETQIIKIRQYNNGTKEIIKQNKYYENLTKKSDNHIFNYIYLHCSLLSNGTSYGAIWKYRDYLHFPRFILFDQTIVQFQYKEGFAYIRQLNPTKMIDPKSLSILNYIRSLEKQYLWGKKPMPQETTEKPLFLNNSYSINYTYKGGDYCGPPIDKNRQTIVTIKCGKAWFQINKVHQTQPCQYWIQIQTLHLCQQNFKDVVEFDDQIPNKGQNDRVIFNGVTCLQEQGAFNRASIILYPGKKLTN